MDQPENQFPNFKRVSQQEIVSNESIPPNVLESIMCPVCLLVLPLPYFECEVCSNTFCPSCLNDWWAKHPNECFYRCNEAKFKKVKRSNTYNAVVDSIKIKCLLCLQLHSYAEHQTHDSHYCPQTKLECQFCKEIYCRKEIDKHQSQCPFRTVKCQYCDQSMQWKELNQHIEEKCENHRVNCEHPNCNQKVKVALKKQHYQHCDFRIMQCNWCSKQFPQIDYLKHQQGCDEMIMGCHWCKKQYKLPQILQHDCQHRQVVCELCSASVIEKKNKEHRIECMFQQMVCLRRANEQLHSQNSRLNMKVESLEEIINDLIKKKDVETMNLIYDMKKREKLAIEKDMQRVQNSMRSVQKLQKEETDAHLKHPHWIPKLCFFCKEIERKFTAMMEPLREKKRELQTKLYELEMYEETVR